jgi:radical SAM superfamily enzyme YgiQ (UPF0313 family)
VPSIKGTFIMRVLMVSANTEQLNMPVLPLGMACVSAAIQSAGHDVRVVNLMESQHVTRLLVPAIEEFEPDVIGVSVRNIDDQSSKAPVFLLPRAKSVIDECKSRSKAPIIVGGPGYSIFPGSALKYLGADFGIQGEGEQAMIDFLARIEKNAPLDGLNGLWTPDKGLMAPALHSQSLDDYPMPKPGVHLSAPLVENRQEIMVPFQTRRGCAMNCSYCSTPAIEGRLPRSRSPEKAVENLKLFVQQGFKNFFFVDNTFNLPRAYAQALCERIAEADLEISWQAIIYPAGANGDLIEKMALAGCRSVSLGFESADESVLSAMNKKYGKKEIRRISELLFQNNIARMGFLLLGGPGETRQSVNDSIEFAKSLELETVKLTAGIRIYPSTPLADIARQKGFIAQDASLLEPAFYLEPGLEGWLQDTVREAVERNPGWMS